MFRAFVLILIATVSVHGQDSTLVRELCSKIGQFSENTDISSEVSEVSDLVMEYMGRNPMTGINAMQDGLRFQYRLFRELGRSCPNYPSDRVRLFPKAVFDFEDKLTKQQIDSLTSLTLQIKRDQQAYIYIITIDDFYPDSTITDFSNRYREFWAPRFTPEKGVVLLAISTIKKQIRISTGHLSKIYLTDDECNEVISVMIQHFRKDEYFDGLTDGLIAIKNRL